MAAWGGVAALPDEALLNHDVLGDPVQRESAAGVAAFLGLHLDVVERATHGAAFTAMGYTRLRRLCRATLGDLTRPADAEDPADRGVGLPMAVARDLLAELGVAVATFYAPPEEQQADGEQVVQQGEVVQPAMVLQAPPTLDVPMFPKGPNLPTRDKYRGWLL